MQIIYFVSLWLNHFKQAWFQISIFCLLPPLSNDLKYLIWWFNWYKTHQALSIAPLFSLIKLTTIWVNWKRIESDRLDSSLYDRTLRKINCFFNNTGIKLSWQAFLYSLIQQNHNRFYVEVLPVKTVHFDPVVSLRTWPGLTVDELIYFTIKVPMSWVRISISLSSQV